MGDVHGSVRRALVPWPQGPRRSPSVRIDSTSTTPNASISGHPASPCRWDFHTAQSTDAYRLEHLSASFPNRGCLASPAAYPPRACLGHDPGRLLAQVGDRRHDVPATLAFELMDPAHPIVDGVLDERVRAADGARGFGRDHARKYRCVPIVRASTLRLGERPSRSSVPGDACLARARQSSDKRRVSLALPPVSRIPAAGAVLYIGETPMKKEFAPPPSASSLDPDIHIYRSATRFYPRD